MNTKAYELILKAYEIEHKEGNRAITDRLKNALIMYSTNAYKDMEAIQTGSTRQVSALKTQSESTRWRPSKKKQISGNKQLTVSNGVAVVNSIPPEPPVVPNTKVLEYEATKNMLKEQMNMRDKKLLETFGNIDAVRSKLQLAFQVEVPEDASDSDVCKAFRKAAKAAYAKAEEEIEQIMLEQNNPGDEEE